MPNYRALRAYEPTLRAVKTSHPRIIETLEQLKRFSCLIAKLLPIPETAKNRGQSLILADSVTDASTLISCSTTWGTSVSIVLVCP